MTVCVCVIMPTIGTDGESKPIIVLDITILPSRSLIHGQRRMDSKTRPLSFTL
jgi:hypothetical protein